MTVDGEAGKGDDPRPVNKKRYDKNYDRIFGCKKKSYPSKTIAEMHMISQQKRNNSFNQHKKVPIRAYFCRKCVGWHLTSQPLKGRS